MKYLLLLIAAGYLLVCCTNQNDRKSNTPRTDELVNSGGHSDTSTYEKGRALLAKNDCLTCHTVEKEMVGPSFVTIATKYHNNEKYADYLSYSIRKGSKGIYGDKEMTPHPNIPFDDLRQMTAYILSVKSSNPNAASSSQ